MNVRRIAAVVVPTTLLALVGPGSLLVYRHRLPEPLATPWGLHRRADGSMSFAASLAIAIVAVVACAVAVIMATRRSTSGPATYLTIAVLLGASIVAGSSTMIVAANIDRASWHEARPTSGWLLVASIIGDLTFTALVVRLVPIATSSMDRTAPLHLGASEQAVWMQSMSIGWMLALSIVLALLGGALTLTGVTRLGGVGLIAVSLVTSMLASIRVTVDRRGLQVAYGPLHFPRTHIRRAQIASAIAIDVRPAEWGVWGYRGSLLLFKRAAVVLRRGRGLRVDLTNGAVFAVTVPDAETGAALLNRLATAPVS